MCRLFVPADRLSLALERGLTYLLNSDPARPTWHGHFHSCISEWLPLILAQVSSSPAMPFSLSLPQPCSLWHNVHVEHAQIHGMIIFFNGPKMMLDPTNKQPSVMKKIKTIVCSSYGRGWPSVAEVDKSIDTIRRNNKRNSPLSKNFAPSWAMESTQSLISANFAKPASTLSNRAGGEAPSAPT